MLSIHRHHDPRLNPHLRPSIAPITGSDDDAAAREYAREAWLLAGAPAERFGEAWDALTTACHYDNTKALLGRFWDTALRIAGPTGPHAQKPEVDQIFHAWFDALLAKHGPHPSAVHP